MNNFFLTSSGSRARFNFLYKMVPTLQSMFQEVFNSQVTNYIQSLYHSSIQILNEKDNEVRQIPIDHTQGIMRHCRLLTCIVDAFSFSHRSLAVVYVSCF